MCPIVQKNDLCRNTKERSHCRGKVRYFSHLLCDELDVKRETVGNCDKRTIQLLPDDVNREGSEVETGTVRWRREKEGGECVHVFITFFLLDQERERERERRGRENESERKKYK